MLRRQVGSTFFVGERFKKNIASRRRNAGFAGHPLSTATKLICLAGGIEHVAVAFDKDSGKEIWRALTAKEPGYCPPMIYEAGGKRQLIIWHPEAMNSLDPETGAVYWSEPLNVRFGLTIPTPRKMDDRLFFTTFYNGSHMSNSRRTNRPSRRCGTRKKPSETETVHLNSIMSTPFLEEGYIYGVCSYGQLRCLKADTGERVWESFPSYDCRRQGAVGKRLSGEERRPVFPVQREGRF